MKRGERINKLGRAIRAYRGVTEIVGGAWIIPPQPALRRRIAEHLESLGLPLQETLDQIDGFKRVSEYDQWINSLRSNRTNCESMNAMNSESPFTNSLIH